MHYYDEDDRYDAMRDAAEEAFRERLEGPCDGAPGQPGEVWVRCSGRHRYGCGGPDCDSDAVECPGCEVCDPDEYE